MAMTTPKKAAVIDMGTNTFHLLLVELHGKEFNTLYKEKVAVKLGQGGITQNQIAEDAEKRALLMKNAQELIELSKTIAPADIVKFDQKLYEDARRALAQLIVVEAGEMDTEGSNEEMSIAHLLSAVHHLFEWYQGEVREGEVAEIESEDIELAAKPEDEEKSENMKEIKPKKASL